MKTTVSFTIILLAAAAAHGQSSLERFNRQLEQIQKDTTFRADQAIPVDQRLFFDFGGYLSFNYFLVEDVNRETHVLRQSDLVGYGRLSVDGVHEAFVRGIARYQDFNDRDSFDSEGDDFDLYIDRAYYRFDLGRYLEAYEGRREDYNLTLTAGRQLSYWANGLVLSNTIDGVMIEAKAGAFELQLLAGVTPIQQAVDFDSSRPHFDDHTSRGFYGALLSWQATSQHRPFAYVLFQQDYNHDDVRSTGVIQTRFNYNTWYAGLGSNGTLSDRLVYGVEFVYEGGRNLSNSFTIDGGSIAPIDQSYDQVKAWAGNVRLDYLLADPRRTRFSTELILASGDDDRRHTSNTFGGNTPGTRDRSFNGFGLLNTGLAFAPNVSNMVALRVGASTFPLADVQAFRKLQIGVDAFVFHKMESDAPIDEPALGGRYLGWEPDFFLNWQLSSDVTLAIRYGVFIPGSDTIVSDQSRQFFFAGLTFAF